MVSDEYLAGIFDGEGCVGAYQRSTGLTTWLAISNTHYELLEAVQEHLGGHITYQENYAIWQVSGADSTKAAKRLLPYSIVKKSQLSAYIELRYLIETRDFSSERAELISLIKKEKQYANV